MFLTILLIAIGFSVGIVLLFRWVNPPFSAYMAERVINAKMTGKKDWQLNHIWTPIEKISPNLALAVITSEDQQFIWHDGFDFEAIDKALEHNGHSKKIRGASTISQQVAKNLFLWPGRTFIRKGFEAYFTVLMELTWPKKRILEMYLNYAEMGEGIFGAGAAARIYWHESPAKLSATQAAMLAAILPSPVKWHVQAPSSRVLHRQAWILKNMYGIKAMGYHQMIMGTRKVSEKPH